MDEPTIEQLNQPEIEEKKTEADKEGRTLLILIIVIVAVFAFSLGGFKVYDNITTEQVLDLDKLHELNAEGKLAEERGYIYNGYSFVFFDGLWWTMMKRDNTLVKIPLHFGPKDVDHIQIIGELSDEFNLQENLYVAVNPTINYNKYYTLSLGELTNNIVQGINRNIITACTEENEACVEREIVSCSNTKGKPAVELVISNKTQVELTGTCIKISGNELNLTKAVDRLLYEWYGIIV